MITHPPYNPEVPPFHYHLFFNLEKHLEGKTMETDEHLKTEVTQYLKKEMATSFFKASIQKLLVQYEKCIQVNFDFVEK